MNMPMTTLIALYSRLLHLYPPKYRVEFEEQMLLDFSDMAADAGRKGIFSLILFCLQELIDFPVNLLRIHFEEGRIFKILRSQPVNNGLRSALGFGIAFGLTLPITMFAYQLLAPIEKLVTDLQVFCYDLFHAEQGFDLISWMPSALSSLFTGLVLGLLIAILFADRSRYPRFIIAGLVGWFFYRAMHDLLTIHFDFWVFLEQFSVSSL